MDGSNLLNIECKLIFHMVQMETKTYIFEGDSSRKKIQFNSFQASNLNVMMLMSPN